MKERGRITEMKGLTIAFLLVLALAGLADSWYLYESAVTDTALSCDIGGGLDGCNAVAQSPYSNLFGYPLALYGVGYYAVVFVLVALIAVRPTYSLRRVLYLLSSIGVVASLIFVGIQAFLIQAFCVYCVISAAIAFLIWVLARALKKQHVARLSADPA